MDLRRLRHLIALAEHRNFGRAASAVYLTQPALSRSIQALEAEVGATLVDRRPSGVELTEIGELVLRHAAALDAGARDLDREIRLAKDLELGELRIGVGPWGGAVLVAPAVGRLNALHPRLRLRVVVAPWRELPDRVRSRDVDIAIGGLGEVEQHDQFEYRSIASYDTVVIGRAGHPLAAAGEVTFADVFSYPLAGAGLNSDAAELLVALAVALSDDEATAPDPSELLTIECDSSDVLKRLLRETDALTFMPPFLVDEELARGTLTVIPTASFGLRIRLGAAWLRGRSLGRAGAAFLDLLTSADSRGR